ncbi:hypothetical protein [Branchiibius cervicis]|uniref:Universal stress protein n=1 Tax=Branchiibius cervicis TaxID=908252 RepID=A0ABW2ASY4_9MICO
MSIVVGFGPYPSTNSGLYLAAQLARTTGDELVLCCIIQSMSDSPALRDPAGIDNEWQQRIREAAAEALAAARDRLPAQLPVTEVVRAGRSVPAMLQREGRPDAHARSSSAPRHRVRWVRSAWAAPPTGWCTAPRSR